MGQGGKATLKFIKSVSVVLKFKILQNGTREGSGYLFRN